MPQININVSKSLDKEQKNALQLEIGNNMQIIPGKTIANTAITINDGLSMFKNGREVEGAFIDIRLYKSSPEESKKAFAEKMFVILNDTIAIKPEFVQINFLEQPAWASNGGYF